MNNNTVRLRFLSKVDWFWAIGYVYEQEAVQLSVTKLTITFPNTQSPYPKEPESCKHNWFEVFRTSHISQYRCTVCNELKTETY